MLGVGGELPPAPGTWEADGDALLFSPRFRFVPGCRYAVVLDGATVGVLDRPGVAARSAVRVAAVHPSGGQVPRNLLRLYLSFTGRMSDGYADGIRFEGAPDAFLPLDEELWDPTRTRLTMFLDPARIKRGLVAHQALGYPLQEGASVRLVVDGMRDAHGAAVERWATVLSVGPDLRHRIDPAQWQLTVPRPRSREPLRVAFDRPLDRGLLLRTMIPPVPGRSEVELGERAWSFVPDTPWQPGAHRIVVQTLLEDVAGNSLRRAFDRDLADARDEPVDLDELELRFSIAPAPG